MRPGGRQGLKFDEITFCRKKEKDKKAARQTPRQRRFRFPGLQPDLYCCLSAGIRACHAVLDQLLCGGGQIQRGFLVLFCQTAEVHPDRTARNDCCFLYSLFILEIYGSLSLYFSDPADHCHDSFRNRGQWSDQVADRFRCFDPAGGDRQSCHHRADRLSDRESGPEGQYLFRFHMADPVRGRHCCPDLEDHG